VGAIPVVALVSSGCLIDRGARAEIAQMRRQVDVSRRQAEAAEKRADELENRVFVLEDRVDTRAVKDDRGAQPPRLPVVKKPAPAARVDDAPAAPGSAVTDRYLDEDGEEVVVIYEGDAARSGSTRPRVSLHESSRPDDMIPVDEAKAARSAPRARRSPRTQVAQAEAGEGVDRLPVTPSVPPPPGDAGPAVAPDADDPVGLYKASYQALTRREHATAIAGFRKFLERFPGHDYADNAQYWLGEAYYDQRDYQAALGEFRRVVKRYPDGNKAPDALLKIGYCYAKLGDLDAARDVLSQVVEIYPKTEAAKLATKRLEELRPQGAGVTP
jgi:tol-pal system protein YbgF